MSDPPLVGDDIHRILRGAHREIKNLLIPAHRQGYIVGKTSKGHYSVSTPQGARPKLTVFMSKTPGDTRGMHRMRRKLRHIGVEYPHT